MPSGGNLVQLDRALQQLRRLDARKHDAVGAAVERASNEVILQVGDADDSAQADERADTADVLHGLEIEVAVFGVDEGPIETGGFQNARQLGRAELVESAADLHLSFASGLS